MHPTAGRRHTTGSDTRDRITAAAWVAAGLGLASAAVSAYWLAGGTALLDTVGGDLEAWGREREPAALAALAAVVVLKLVVALAAPAYAGRGRPWLPAWCVAAARTAPARGLGWLAAAVLAAYGGLLTAVGLAVEAGLVEPARDADRRAIRWHALLWDPWFLLWGLALGLTLWWTRPRRQRSDA